MGRIVPQEQIASAYFVAHGQYGAVSHYARQRGVCRQWVYREAAGLVTALTAPAQELAALRATVRQLRQDNAALQKRLTQAVVIDDDKQAEVVSVGQARGVTLRDCWAILAVLIPGQVASVPTLGRRAQAAGARAGQLLAVLDEVARLRTHEVAADEIYVKDPVLMVVEPDSLCWLSGRLSTAVSGAAWKGELAALPQLEQVTRDGGSGLAKGVALVNAQRQADAQAAVVDQGDHFHALRGGGVGLRKAAALAHQAYAAAEAADKKLAECDRQGHKRTGPALRARWAWQKAEQALDRWSAQERLWQRTKEALLLFTATGELNTRERAAAVLAETLPQLPDSDFAKAKRQLHQPEMLNYLDRVQQQIAALPFAAEVKQAAVRQEGLRRRPEALQRRGPASSGAARHLAGVCGGAESKWRGRPTGGDGGS